MKQNRILAIHRYFWPDTPPYASMLRVIARHWVRDGHEVYVLSSQPSYKPEAAIPKRPAKEELEGIHVRRMNLPKNEANRFVKLVNMAFFTLGCFLRIVFGKKYDFVMASTVPQVILGAACCLACTIRGSRFIYHCMDIHPEIGRISGEFSGKFIFTLLQKIDSWTCKHAYKVVVLSQDMEKALHSRPASGKVDVEIINNFALPVFESEGPMDRLPGPQKKEDVIRFVFAGNIGRFQNLDLIVDALASIDNQSDIEILFVGEGKAKPTLQDRAGSLLNKQIFFLPHQPLSVAKKIIQTADMGIISLTPGIISYAYPSKTMTYLAEGCPLFAIVEQKSELADFIHKENLGLSCAPNDVQGIAQNFAYLLQNRHKIDDYRKSAVAKGKDYFDQERILQRWSQVPISRQAQGV
jgi:glycosyltransferase involved in cell wall biosynthesis